MSKVGIPGRQMALPHTARFRDQVPSILFLCHHLGSIVVCMVTARLQVHQYSGSQEGGDKNMEESYTLL